MDSFDKKIKNAFDHMNGVPKDFNWEHMESGILDKMNKPNPAITNNVTNAINWKLWTFFVVTTIIGAYFFINIDKQQTSFTKSVKQTNIKSDKNPNFKTTPITLIESKSKESIKSNIQKSSLIDLKDKTKNDKISKTKNNNTSITPEKTNNTQKLKIEIANNIHHKNIESNSTISTSSMKSTILNNINIVKYETISYTSSPNSNKLYDDSNVGSHKTNNQFLVNNKKTRSDILQKRNAIVIDMLSIKENVLLLPKKRIVDIIKIPLLFVANKLSSNKLNIAIDINSGTNVWLGNYNNSPVLNRYSKKQLGYYNSIDIVLPSKKWDFTLGYQHQYLNELIDYKKVTQVDTTFTDVVIAYNVESYSSISSEIKGDVTVQRDRTRKIVNYNTLRSHSINIGAIRKFELTDKIAWGIGLGMSYTFNTLADGVSLDNLDKHTIYNHNLPNYFGIQTGLNLQYNLSQKWSIISNISAKQNLTSWNINKLIINNPQVIKLGLGLRYYIQ